MSSCRRSISGNASTQREDTDLLLRALAPYTVVPFASGMTCQPAKSPFATSNNVWPFEGSSRLLSVPRTRAEARGEFNESPLHPFSNQQPRLSSGSSAQREIRGSTDKNINYLETYTGVLGVAGIIFPPRGIESITITARIFTATDSSAKAAA